MGHQHSHATVLRTRRGVTKTLSVLRLGLQGNEDACVGRLCGVGRALNVNQRLGVMIYRREGAPTLRPIPPPNSICL